MPARQVTPTRSHVELTPLSTTTWRVCDDRFEAGDLRYIVGYLHTNDDGYEMLWMRPHPGGVYRHPDFESAVDAITLRLELTSDAR